MTAETAGPPKAVRRRDSPAALAPSFRDRRRQAEVGGELISENDGRPTCQSAGGRHTLLPTTGRDALSLSDAGTSRSWAAVHVHEFALGNGEVMTLMVCATREEANKAESAKLRHLFRVARGDYEAYAVRQKTLNRAGVAGGSNS